MSNGKSDMRGKPVTVLSDKGRDTWDRVFGKKKPKKKSPTQK